MIAIRAADTDPRIAIVGDSITVVSKAALTGALGPDHDLDIRAGLGVRIDAMADEAAELAARSPDQAVIELGSNDVLQGVDLEASAAALEQMVRTFTDAGVECVHIVNVSTRMRRNDGVWTGDRAEALNEATAAMAAGDDHVVIVDWNGAVLDAEERGETLTPDTVHPDLVSANVVARLIGNSLDEGCPATR